ncbi:MAG: hypothetical protein JSW46_19450 [Gemmatimonadota bacterium]|nr:MAG: hypothetical protein JSW46_19450 [Gemmatimonadota bacterium]
MTYTREAIKGLHTPLTLLLIGAITAASFAGCADEPTTPGGGEEANLPQGLNVYLTLDDRQASPGSSVRVTGKVQAVGVDLTPTGFLVRLNYDPAKLEPIAARSLEDGVLRAVNIGVGPGLVKAAGASADGLSTDLLFELDMKVKKAGYAEDLSIAVDELGVIERNFADHAADVVVVPQVLVVPAL